MRVVLLIFLAMSVTCRTSDVTYASTFAAEGPGIAAEAWREDRNLDAWLIAPVPEAVLGGLLTIDAAFTERTTVREHGYHDIRQVLKTGLIWHPHHKEGAPRYYLAAARKGLADERKTIRPLGLYTIGTRIIDDDLPFRLAFSATDMTFTHAFITWHRFPQYNRFKGGLSHRIRMKTGLILELNIPDRFEVAFATDNDDWRVFGAWETDTEYIPYVAATERGWNEETAEKKQIGVRIRMTGPLYAVLTAGKRRMQADAFSYKGEKLAVEQTGFVPFLRLAMETWVSVL